MQISAAETESRRTGILFFVRSPNSTPQAIQPMAHQLLLGANTENQKKKKKKKFFLKIFFNFEIKKKKKKIKFFFFFFFCYYFIYPSETISKVPD